MEEHELVKMLRTFPRPPDVEEAFVARTTDEARLPARVAVRLWVNGDDDVALGAHGYLQAIGELAIEPLLEGAPPRQPERISQTLELLVESELGLRTRVMLRVDALLADRRRVPPPPSLGPVEERPDDRRVCDEAYVAMRRLVHFGEPAWDLLGDARQFYRAPESARDAAIAAARGTNEWRHALRGPGAGDE